MEQAQKTFSYVARDASGARQSGVVSGLDTNDATRVLRAQGTLALMIPMVVCAASSVQVCQL